MCRRRTESTSRSCRRRINRRRSSTPRQWRNTGRRCVRCTTIRRSMRLIWSSLESSTRPSRLNRQLIESAKGEPKRASKKRGAKKGGTKRASRKGRAEKGEPKRASRKGRAEKGEPKRASRKQRAEKSEPRTT